MHVNVIISTFDRLDTIQMTIDSLLGGTYKDISIHIIVDGNLEMYEKLKSLCIEKNGDIIIHKNEERKDVIYSWNKILVKTRDGCILYATDDIVFYRDCIRTALCAMKRYFPDTDSVIGLNQIQNGISKGRKYAFGLVGKKFAERFPGKKLFCPEYIHFNGDRELGLYAMGEGKFYYCANAKLDHMRLPDETTKLGMKVYKSDKVIFRKRQATQLLWGRNFGLLEET